jgi:3-O-methylgallate 3,4-dioxygenase
MAWLTVTSGRDIFGRWRAARARDATRRITVIALGIGTSHTPMLSMTAASWERWGARDVGRSDLLDGDGLPVTYDALVERAPAGLDTQIDVSVYAAKLQRTNAALDELAVRIAEARLDVMVVVGDDQNEQLGAENLPPVLVYHGDTLRNTHAEVRDGAAPEIAELTRGYHEPDGDVDYPVDAELALRLIGFLLDHNFDVASSARLPRPGAEGHALQFPHRRLLGRDLPVVPVLLNTYLPPTQPRAARCYDLGVELAAAIESIGDEKRVGFLASGGLSHFVVQPDWDRCFLDALVAGDRDYLRSIPEAQLQSGTSEAKNWITVAGACAGLHFTELDYVPGYRTPAGTGTGMAFGVWQ